MKLCAFQVFLCILCGLLNGCARQAVVDNTAGFSVMVCSDAEIYRCGQVYPHGRWQFVHAIDFSLQNGRGSQLIGVTTVDGEAIKCALLTIEGLTLFAGQQREAGAVPEVFHRLAPFDKKGFARGLFADLRTLFIPPAGDATMQCGSIDGDPACRIYRYPGSVDIILRDNGCWTLLDRNADGHVTRRVTTRNCVNRQMYTVPEILTLATGHYTLRMRLVRAERLSGRDEH